MNRIGIRALIALGALLVTGAVNQAIVGKERIKRDGDVVYLKLVPVDPRSLMQGDYMALRFAFANALEKRRSKTGEAMREGETRRAGVALDALRVGTPAANDEQAGLRLRYRLRNGRIWLGTNAFFFEEGSAGRFAGARYGEFRVDRASGEAVLTGLRNAELQPL